MSKKTVELTMEQTQKIISNIMSSIDEYNITETSDDSISAFKGNSNGIYIEVIQYRNGASYAIINDDNMPDITINLTQSGAKSLYTQIKNYIESLKREDIQSIFNRLNMDTKHPSLNNKEEKENKDSEDHKSEEEFNEFINMFDEIFGKIFNTKNFLEDLHNQRDVNKCSKCNSKDECPINNYKK